MSARIGPNAGVGRLAATVQRLRQEVQQAQTTAAGRSLIELAKGVLVERLGCGPAQAAQQLDIIAEATGESLLEVAADIIDQAARDQLASVAQELLEEPNDLPALNVRLRTAESTMLAAKDTQSVAASLLEHALGPLGAVAVAVWAAAPDGSLRLAGYAGFTAAEAGRWHYVPPMVATLARQALTERGAVQHPDLAECSIPSIGRYELPEGGRIVLPSGTGGRILGVLEICWPAVLPSQPPAVQRQLEALADLCAHTLDVEFAPEHGSEGSPLNDIADAVLDSAIVLQPLLDGGGAVVDFHISHANRHFADLAGKPRSVVVGSSLLETYPMVAADNGLFEKIHYVYATGEPLQYERLRSTTLVGQVPITIVADVSIQRHGTEILFIWRLHDEATRLADLLNHAQRLGRIGGFEESLTTGQITWNSQLYHLFGLAESDQPVPVQRLAGYAHEDDAMTIGRFLRSLLHHRAQASTAFRLRRPDGTLRHIRVVAEPVADENGHLIAVRGAFQDISAQHWTEVALAATRDQLSHSQKEADDSTRLALELQQAIMPTSTPPVAAAGLQIAVRYRPAESRHLVGGDWYDAVPLPSEQTLVSIGDIAGHGMQAATDMIVLRNALRGLAATGAGPGQLLAWLNNVTLNLPGRITATALCALYDPQTRILRWARAGHPTPILLHHGEAAALPMIGGLLLGAAANVDYEEGELELASGDTLIMYTDGLIESRDRTFQESLDDLIELAAAPRPTLEGHLDDLLIHSSSDTDDDTCIIAIRAD